MKYTDRFFKFPIRIYDGYSMSNAEEEEDALKEKTGSLEKVPVEFVVGVKAMLPDDILGYMESYSKDHIISEIREVGFPITLVESKESGFFECNWPRKKFEDKLNEFIESFNTKKDLEKKNSEL